MPGGLMQLVNKGAQDHLVTGQPSFTHFKSVYKRHTEFAMEHYLLNFRATNLNLHPTQHKLFRARVDRSAQLLHDCYVNVTLPDIYSPVHPIGNEAKGYEFQWITNIGYNMIRHVSILINGTAIVTHTGEWLKLHSYLHHDKNTREKVDQMIGNIPELYNPAYSYGKFNQYPHSITKSLQAAPSILGRELTIPLHFWFCEDVGSSLPLISLQYSEVEFVIEFRSIYELFTIIDVDPLSSTFNQRIAPNPSKPLYSLDKFLSPPKIDTTPLNPSLTTWELRPSIQATYIFLSDPEMIQLAKSDTSYIIHDLRPITREGIRGSSNDIELTMTNLCTRIVWTSQRSDVLLNNNYDNYTNWDNGPKLKFTDQQTFTQLYTSGYEQGSNLSLKDSMVDATIIFDGANREETKSTSFYKDLQNYRHIKGSPLPGVYMYSFSLDHYSKQPSGHVNGSMFNTTLLRISTLEPPINPSANETTLCILKSTALNPRPTIVVNPAVYNPDEVLTIINKRHQDIFPYTFVVTAHVESYNFLRVYRGIANVVFSS